jgi:argininosuccinate lyase
MSNRIIYQNATGGVSVIVPSQEYLENHTIEELAEKDVPAGTIYKIVDVSEIPSDRTFRDAWTIIGDTVEHDLAKAKDIAHAMRRVNRAKDFAPLDVEATIPSKAVAAEAARQAIREKYAVVQMNIDGSKTIESLKTAIQANS